MTTSFATCPDEKQLAQLICSKLTKMMQGVLSVGAAAVQSENADFLHQQATNHAAHIEVLASTGGRVETAELVREKAHQLQQSSRTFFDQFDRLIAWRSMTLDKRQGEIKHLAAAYEDCLQTLQEIAAALEMESDFQNEIRVGRQIAESFTDLLAQE